MDGTDAADLFSGFTEPLVPFPYLVALILLALPLATFLGFHLGNREYHRRGYGKMPSEQIPGGTSLGAMLALLGLLLGFAFSSALGWREARQSALVEEAAAISTAFLIANLLDDPGRTDLQVRILTYAETRLAASGDIRTKEAWTAFLARTLEAQADIWPAKTEIPLLCCLCFDFAVSLGRPDICLRLEGPREERGPRFLGPYVA